MNLRLEIRTPLNNISNTNVVQAAANAVAGVWAKEPTKRNMDIDVKCSAESRMNC